MACSRSGKTGFAAALAAGSALLMATWLMATWPMATWGAQAQADAGGGGAFKVVGASYTQELKFAGCMRQHGEPDFPDPSSDGVFSLNGVDPGSPEYQGAQKACQNLLPKQRPPSPAEQAKLLEKALAFAGCMRRHGEPDFPDPSSNGGSVNFSLRGVDPRSPQYQRAESACQKLSPFSVGPGGP
jgi:hypothetical protein